MRVLPDRGIAVKARHENGTWLWLRRPGSTDFIKIKETPVKIHSIAIDANGTLLLGAEAGRVYALEDGDLALRWDLHNQEEGLVGSSFAGICAVDPTRTLVQGESPEPVLIDSQRASSTLRVDTSAWTDCAPTSASRILLLHKDRVSVLDLSHPGAETITPATFQPPEAQPGTTHQLVRMVREGRIEPGYAWLLGERFIWVYAPEEATFRPLVERPPRLQSESSKIRLAVDEAGVWLATPESGVWRWSGDPLRVNNAAATSPARWKAWNNSHGLPSSNVRAILPWEKGQAILFTSGGMALGRRRGAGDWTFKHLRQDGIMGERVRAAALFRPEGRDDPKVVALGTEKSLSLGILEAAPGEPPHVSRWSHLDRNDGLNGEVHAIHRSDTTRELWIGTDQEVSLFRPTPEDQPLSFEKADSLGEADGLPPGPHTQLRVSPGGDEAWIVSGHRITRWRRSTGELTSSDAYLFHSAEPHLGPATGDRGPRLLVRDLEGRPVVWDLGNEAKPRLEVADRLFWVHVRLVVDHLGFAVPDGTWSARFVLDRLPGAGQGSTRRLRLAPDLLRRPRPHTLAARVTHGATGRSFVVLTPLPQLGFGIWLGRLAFLLFLAGGGSGTVAYLLARSRSRRQRVRIQEVPYIAGKAVEGESFFGREVLMRKLLDTAATTSYALLGPFRIGKSSIQHQLTRSLEYREDPRHVFFPLYLDLSHLHKDPRDWDDHFFHFLGQNLLRFVRNRKLDPEVLARLGAQRRGDPAAYGSLELLGDVEVLLDHWRARHQPRQPVLLLQIDEVGLMHRLSYNTLLAFRSVFAGSHNVRVVLSGKTLPANQAGDGSSPWRSFLEEIEVRPLKPAEARRLIVEPARGLFHFEHDAVNEIIGLGEGQPMILQKLCANVLRYMYEKGHARQKITREDFEASLRWADEQGFDLFTIEGQTAGEVEVEPKEPKGDRDESMRRGPAGAE